MTANPHFVEVGSFLRVHGLHGHLVLKSEVAYPDELLEIPVFYVHDSRGDLVPHRIEEIRYNESDRHETFFVKFEHTHDRTAAEPLRGRRIYVNTLMHSITPPDDDAENDEITRFLNWSAFYNNLNGTITQVMQNPAQDIIEVTFEKHSSPVLIPWVDHFIESVNEDDQNITLREIDPLLEL